MMIWVSFVIFVLKGSLQNKSPSAIALGDEVVSKILYPCKLRPTAGGRLSLSLLLLAKRITVILASGWRYYSTDYLLLYSRKMLFVRHISTIFVGQIPTCTS